MSTNPQEAMSLEGDGLYPKLKDDNEAESIKEKQKDDICADGMALFVKATDFAARRHRFQKRKDPTQTPYINHPVGLFITSVYNLLLIFQV
jgi:(p)ppGpp synthase/HD superfamily hydrolase